MLNNHGHPEIDKSRPDKTEAAIRKPYRSPRLEVYGDLGRITAGGGGSKQDGKSGLYTKAG